MAQPSVAFLSKSKLHVRQDGVTKRLDSEFERTVRERAASIERRHAWKTQGSGARFMGRAVESSSPADIPAILTGLSAGPDGGFLYSMETDAISGLFLLDSEGVETRLFHTADLRLRHATLDPTGGTVAATAFHPGNLRSNIALLPLRGNEFSELTEGDSFDQLPQWVPGSRRKLVFQSAGIGRNVAGHFAGLGPCAIQELDVDSGSLEEIAVEDSHDLLQPRQTEDGTLYYIRKPYESGVAKASVAGSLKDTALFPLRMARALFQYFNVFSMMYTGKPLVTGKGAVQRPIDPRQAFIHGNLARAFAGQQTEEESPTGVPSSWELVRRLPGGQIEVVARSVLAYDLARDGAILSSNGKSITRHTPDGHSERVLEAELIERVLAL